jgi:hypothetical protein
LDLVKRLEPVSFVYNGSEQVRYGFIAEDAANVDAHLATYDAAGTVSGIDDRSILAILVGAIKQLWEKVLALIENDEAQNARIQQLEYEVAALKAAAGAPGDVSGAGAPSGSSTGAAPSADRASTTTPASDDEAAGSDAAENAAAGTPEVSGTEAPAVDAAAAGEGTADDAGSTMPSDNEPQTPAANDNQPDQESPATGSE